jgi:hypothetical protein
VVVSCGSDAARWAPLDQGLHTVMADYPACRPCVHAVCPTDHACANNIGVEEVAAAALRMAQREFDHA